MLVLTRKRDEAIIIGEGENRIMIHILGINGNRASIGIDAPKALKIVRSEIADSETLRD